MKTIKYLIFIQIIIAFQISSAATLNEEQVTQLTSSYKNECLGKVEKIQSSFKLNDKQASVFCKCYAITSSINIKKFDFENPIKFSETDLGFLNSISSRSFEYCVKKVKSIQKNDSPIGYDSVDSAINALESNPNSKIRKEDDWTIIELRENGGLELWNFPPTDHPSSPAAIRRKLIEKNGEIFVDLKAICGGTKDACDALITQYRSMADSMKKDIEKLRTEKID